MKSEKHFYIFALAATGSGISGSDRIFMEFARRWSETYKVSVYVCEEGKVMCERQNLKGKNLQINLIKVSNLSKLGFIFTYFYRILLGIKLGLTFHLTTHDSRLTTIVYSASEFWMDSLPALLLKLRYGKKVKLVASWYQTAPNPLHGYIEQNTNLSASQTGNIVHRNASTKYFLSSLFYWLVQLPIKPLISKFADKIIVNNEDERKQFPVMNKLGHVIVLIGAVPLGDINKYLTTHNPQPAFKFDAVFQGRFHPQKGVVELIDIWQKVTEKRPDAKLAMIGDGPLMYDVIKLIAKNKLTNNIKLFGYLFDGPDKYKIFSRSKVVVHPAFYDSGGMASAEAMAFGLPCVGFNLKAYESYYPKGMIKVTEGNLQEFANVIINLLDNEKERRRVGKEARQMIVKNWSWDKRANEVLGQIIYDFK